MLHLLPTFQANSQDIAQRLKKKNQQEQEVQEDEPMIKQKVLFQEKILLERVKKAK